MGSAQQRKETAWKPPILTYFVVVIVIFFLLFTVFGCLLEKRDKPSDPSLLLAPVEKNAPEVPQASRPHCHTRLIHPRLICSGTLEESRWMCQTFLSWATSLVWSLVYRIQRVTDKKLVMSRGQGHEH